MSAAPRAKGDDRIESESACRYGQGRFMTPSKWCIRQLGDKMRAFEKEALDGTTVAAASSK
jgi:hypothetical protein